MSNLISKKTEVAEVVTRDITPEMVNTDAGAYSRAGWLIVLIGVLGFILWASFAPLDKGVPMPGTVTKEGNRKSVQHLSGGTVQEILVKDGDVVKAGQVLVRINSVSAKSQLETTRAQYFTARLAEARLTAERNGAKTVTFPVVLQEFKDDPRVVEGFALQQQLFNSRRLSLESELGGIDENIAGLKLQIVGMQEARESKKAQLSIIKEQLDNIRELAKDGYVARSKQFDTERLYAQLNGDISQDIGNIGRGQRQITELQLRRMQRMQDYQKEVRTQLSDVQKEAEALAGRMSSQNYDLAQTEVRAPVDGTVVAQAVFTTGGVVGAGQKLMEVVPSGDALVVEGQLPVNLIDRVRDGMPVELMFSAFNVNRTPHIPGVVIQVSADRTVDERSGTPYYKVRARVTPEGAKLIAQKKMDVQPGMPVEMFVKTGERTMMSYLLKPVFDRAKTSMTED